MVAVLTIAPLTGSEKYTWPNQISFPPFSPAVEEEKLRGDIDRLLFFEGDLRDRGAFADQRGPAGLEGGGGVGRL